MSAPESTKEPGERDAPRETAEIREIEPVGEAPPNEPAPVGDEQAAAPGDKKPSSQPQKQKPAGSAKAKAKQAAGEKDEASSEERDEQATEDPTTEDDEESEGKEGKDEQGKKPRQSQKTDEAEEQTAEGEDTEETEGEASRKPSRYQRKRTPRVSSPAEAKAVLECVLFAATEPLPLRRLREIARGMKEKELRGLLVELQNEYDSRGSGLQIVEVAGGFQMATRPRYTDWLMPFRKRKRQTGLSAAMLETLAIIAYKQPIIRAEVDAIRGVDSSGTIHVLQELEMIEVTGQKQVPGRPFLYATTQDFLKKFGLKSLSDLPSIESLRERFESTQE